MIIGFYEGEKLIYIFSPVGDYKKSVIGLQRVLIEYLKRGKEIKVIPLKNDLKDDEMAEALRDCLEEALNVEMTMAIAEIIGDEVSAEIIEGKNEDE